MRDKPPSKHRSDWVFYGYNRCATCRKALAFLKESGVTPEIRDIVAEGVPSSVLKAALRQGNTIKDLFNRSGQVYRQQRLKDRLVHMTQTEALALLERDGRLIRRPILFHRPTGTVLVGFHPSRYAEVVSSLR